MCRASEGKTVEVPYRGDVTATMLDVLGGIRSACTYVGAGKLKEMSKRTTFIRLNILSSPQIFEQLKNSIQPVEPTARL